MKQQQLQAAASSTAYYQRVATSSPVGADHVAAAHVQQQHPTEGAWSQTEEEQFHKLYLYRKWLLFPVYLGLAATALVMCILHYDTLSNHQWAVFRVVSVDGDSNAYLVQDGHWRLALTIPVTLFLAAAAEVYTIVNKDNYKSQLQTGTHGRRWTEFAVIHGVLYVTLLGLTGGMTWSMLVAVLTNHCVMCYLCCWREVVWHRQPQQPQVVLTGLILLVYAALWTQLATVFIPSFSVYKTWVKAYIICGFGLTGCLAALTASLPYTMKSRLLQSSTVLSESLHLAVACALRVTLTVLMAVVCLFAV